MSKTKSGLELGEVDTGLFELGDVVEVLANKGDMFHDFMGTVCGFRGKGIVSVRDQEDNVWDCGENQCEKVDY